MKTHRDLDLVVYGASGFTGKLVAEHLNRLYGVGGELNWAMGGRSLKKLQATRDELSIGKEVPLVVADSKDMASLTKMVQRSKAVLTTVGPYQQYGDELIAACVAYGTDYLDLCGEVNWLQDKIGLHDEAQKSGARIVLSAGFDSIPFDLGVFYLQQRALEMFGAPVSRVKCRLRSIDVLLSGGTVASYRAIMAAAENDPATAAMLSDPFALAPGFTGPDQPLGAEPEYEEELNSWTAPFIMAMINTKNIHRSNYLLGHAYGEDFVYDEMLLTGPGKAGEDAARFIAEDGSINENPIQPGEGPTKAERDAAYYDLLFIGSGPTNQNIRVAVKGQGDPGYGSTSKIIAEAAVCLLEDADQASGGVWTAASLMGPSLLERLSLNADLSFEVES